MSEWLSWLFGSKKQRRISIGAAVLASAVPISNLPPEILDLVAKGASVNDIVALCSTNTYFAQVCQSQELWQQLISRDFPLDVEPADRDYHRAYRQLFEFRKTAYQWANETLRLSGVLPPSYVCVIADSKESVTPIIITRGIVVFAGIDHSYLLQYDWIVLSQFDGDPALADRGQVYQTRADLPIKEAIVRVLFAARRHGSAGPNMYAIRSYTRQISVHEIHLEMKEFVRVHSGLSQAVAGSASTIDEQKLTLQFDPVLISVALFSRPEEWKDEAHLVIYSTNQSANCVFLSELARQNPNLNITRLPLPLFDAVYADEPVEHHPADACAYLIRLPYVAQAPTLWIEMLWSLSQGLRFVNVQHSAVVHIR